MLMAHPRTPIASQDSALIGRLGRIITTRFIKFLQEQARKDPKKYREFFEEYSRFLREGIYSDHNNRVGNSVALASPPSPRRLH